MILPIQFFYDRSRVLELLKIIKTVGRSLGYKDFRKLSCCSRDWGHQKIVIKAAENHMSKGTGRNGADTFNQS